jgi:hypothetical protein
LKKGRKIGKSIPFLPSQANNHTRALLLEQDKVVEKHLGKRFATD